MLPDDGAPSALSEVLSDRLGSYTDFGNGLAGGVVAARPGAMRSRGNWRGVLAIGACEGKTCVRVIDCADPAIPAESGCNRDFRPLRPTAPNA